MADDPKPTEQEQDTDAAPSTDERTETERATEETGEKESPLLKALREERDARKEAERRLKKREQADRDAETARAVKAGEWESVAKSKDAEIADLNARLADLEAERDNARLETVRERVAAKYRLPTQLAARLRGANETELDADAKELAKLVAPPKAPDTQGGGNGQHATATTEELQRGLARTGRYNI